MSRPPDHTFKPEGRVTAGAIEPCGSRLALAFQDGAVEVRAAGGDVQRRLDPGPGPWSALAFSADGKSLAGGGRDGRLFVAEASSGRVVASTAPRGGRISGLALSADGAFLVAASDAEARFVRVRDGATLFSLAASPAEVQAVAVARAGDRVAVGLSDTLLRVFSPEGKVVASVDDLAMAPFALAFSPDGRLLACGCADGAITIRDAASGARSRSDVRSHGPLGALGFAPDGSWAVAVGISMNPATRESSAHVVPVHGDGSTSIPLDVLPNVAVGVSADGTVHVVAGDRTGTRMWDLSRPAGAGAQPGASKSSS